MNTTDYRDTAWLHGEIELYINNTQDLYYQALEIKDFNIDNNSISVLLAQVLRKIRQDSGNDFDPYKFIKSMPETKRELVKYVKELQEQMKA